MELKKIMFTTVPSLWAVIDKDYVNITVLGLEALEIRDEAGQIHYKPPILLKIRIGFYGKAEYKEYDFEFDITEEIKKKLEQLKKI